MKWGNNKKDFNESYTKKELNLFKWQVGDLVRMLSENKINENEKLSDERELMLMAVKNSYDHGRIELLQELKKDKVPINLYKYYRG